MTNSSILERVAPLAPPPAQRQRDVAVIIGAGDPPDTLLLVAGQHAADANGVLRIMRFIDLDRLPTGRERTREARAARSQLAAVVERFRAKAVGVRVTERLHFGPLNTLLDSLETTVGTVVVSATPEDGWTEEVVSSCKVPVWLVGRTGTVASTGGTRAPAV